VIGTLLGGRYRVERLLGEGGMGAVYDAVHVESGRRVAVKVISTAELARTAEIRARFAREATAASAIETRHIVQVIESGTDEKTDLPFMVMELLRGEDVQHVLERFGAVPDELALRIAAQACVGLQRAHDAGVVHRDVKPANLYLSESASRTSGELVVKLLDFGIAKVKMDELGNTAAGLTRTGNMLGTPLYMSPEQAKGLKTIDHRTDLWSLGAVLYQMVSGVPPHDQQTVGQLILAICGQPPRPVQEVAPWVSPEVAAILWRALRIDPADRYQRATDMLEDIGAQLRGNWSISPTMVVALPEEQRKNIARRVVVSDPPRGSSRDSLEEAGVASTTAMRTTGGLARRLSSIPPHLRKLSPVAIGAVVGAAAALGIGGWLSMRPAAPAAPLPEEPIAPVASAPSAVPATPATLEPTAPAASAEPQPAVPRVRLSVPGATRVSVDGQDTPIDGGVVEISGKLGSKHTVQVAAGDRKLAREVFVTESGAVPDRIELPKPALAPVAAGKPTAAATAATPATARPPATAPAPATKFE
jgi:serine/threonine-protein kinase